MSQLQRIAREDCFPTGYNASEFQFHMNQSQIRMTEYSSGKGADFLTGRLLARNAGFNLAGEFVSFCVGVICVPFVVRRLGTDSFGVLSIAWALLSYMSLFDLGLSRATTKFVAEAVSTGEHQKIPSLVWTSISLQVALGIFGGALLAGSSHLLAERILKIPHELIREAETAFLFLALAVPIVLISNSLRGVLEAVQRFHLINYVKTPTNILMFATPMLLIPFGGRISSIIALMTVFRLLAMVALLKFCLPLVRVPSVGMIADKHLLRQLFKYGGWVTVSNVAGPLLLYADRFAIGALLSVGALAYYSGPADMVNRFLVIPVCLGSTLFPAFSSLDASGARQKLQDIYGRALTYLVIVMGPLLLLVAAFSSEILRAWLGPVFARQGALPLQILAVGIFINALGIFPYSLLQGVGRPDLTAMFHVLELPLHLGLVWILVSRMGITGAAIAVVTRLAIDLALVLWACERFGYSPSGAIHRTGVTKSLAGLVFIAGVLLAASYVQSSLLHRAVLASVAVLCYYMAQWHWTLDLRDRQFLQSIVQQLPLTEGAFRPHIPEQRALIHSAKSPEAD
jgi:O-antigen/teichoic acid export membrane protein